MIITKVKYERLFPAGVYLNEKIGFEADVEDGEAMKAIDELRKLAEYTHRETYPQYYVQEPIQLNGSSQETHEEIKIGLTVEDINSCLDKKVLESYKYVIKGKPELESAYLTKMKEFI